MNHTQREIHWTYTAANKLNQTNTSEEARSAPGVRPIFLSCITLRILRFLAATSLLRNGKKPSPIANQTRQ